MELQKKLYLYASLMLAVSVVGFSIIFFLFSGKSIVSLSFIFGLVFMSLHQVASWYILYQFVITRKRMGNKIHLFNKISVGIAAGFGVIYLVFIQFIGLPMTENVKTWITFLVAILIPVFIFFQENNTNNYVSFDFHKKTNQTKKSLNQSIGFITTWMYINILWFSIGFHMQLNVFVFIFLILLLIQNGLAYTTYGQSRYWNFTYELVYLVFILAIALTLKMQILYTLAILLGIAFVYRQWMDLEYSPQSRIVGGLLFIGLAVGTLVNPLNIYYMDYSVSKLVPFVGLGYGCVFMVAYIINNPRFIKKLMKK